ARGRRAAPSLAGHRPGPATAADGPRPGRRSRAARGDRPRHRDTAVAGARARPAAVAAAAPAVPDRLRRVPRTPAGRSPAVVADGQAFCTGLVSVPSPSMDTDTFC